MSIKSTLLLCVLWVVGGLAHSASYPANIDYGSQGDFITKRGVEFGRTSNLTPIGPILLNFPEGPGSTDVAIDEYRFEDTAWDLSDLTNPTLIRSLTCETCFAAQPIAAHATVIQFVPDLGPLIWNGDESFYRFDENEANSNSQLQLQAFPGWGVYPASYSRMFSPYHMRTYWGYGLDTSGLYSIRDPSRPIAGGEETAFLGASENHSWLGESVVAWDHLGATGVTGFTSWFGNLLIVSSDQQSTGMAIYDVSGFKEGAVPQLLSVFNPVLTEPNGNITGIGGYWVEPYGTNKMVFAARENEELSPSRAYPAIYIVDFTDPENPFLSCEIYFDQNKTDPSDGDPTSDPMYVNFQDQYAYVDHFRVDIPACEEAYIGDGEVSEEEFSAVVYKFNDNQHQCDASQYFRPLGQVGIFGGYDWWATPDVNEQGMCFMVTSDDPDTRPPFISGHRPLADQTNYPVDGYIHLHIPETLRSETLMNAFSVTVVGSGQSIPFRHQISHTGTVSIWPTSDLPANVTINVQVSGIQDFMGNTMEPYSFSFSTGDEIAVVPDPDPVDPDPVDPEVPTYSGDHFFANQSSELACTDNSDTGIVWAVNPDNDTVTLIDPNYDFTANEANPVVLREINLGYEAPTSVAQAGGQYVITYRDDDKVIFYTDQGLPLASVDTGHGSQPVSVVADSDYVYVALYGKGQVAKISIASRQIVAVLDVGPTPKAMALHNGRLLVTRFISTSEYGEIFDINVAGDMELVDTIRANKVLVPDDIDHGSGVPNYLSSVVITPDGSTAYITAIKANIDRGPLKNGLSLDDDNTVRPMMVTLDLNSGLDANIDPSTRENSIDFDNGSDPTGVTLLVNPAIRVHTQRGNNAVVAYDSERNSVAVFSTQFAPQHMCATPRTLYVKNRTSRSVSAIDVAGFIANGDLGPRVVHINTVTHEVLNDQELQGLRLFYHSRIPEMGPEGYMSCASCHDSGGHDGMVWDLTHMGEGFRNTISLNGSSGTRFGNLHWSGNFDEVEDFEIQLEHLNHGTGLISGNTFATANPLNHQSAGLSEELDALAAYVNGLGRDTVKRSPYRTYNGELTSSASRGQLLFSELGCASCHAGSAFRDGLLHDVGTIKLTSGQRLGGNLEAIRTPTLIELWESAPYFHDGSAASLEDVLSEESHSRDLDEIQMEDLINFLLSIDREMYIEDGDIFIPSTM